MCELVEPQEDRFLGLPENVQIVVLSLLEVTDRLGLVAAYEGQLGHLLRERAVWASSRLALTPHYTWHTFHRNHRSMLDKILALELSGSYESEEAVFPYRLPVSLLDELPNATSIHVNNLVLEGSALNLKGSESVTHLSFTDVNFDFNSEDDRFGLARYFSNCPNLTSLTLLDCEQFPGERELLWISHNCTLVTLFLKLRTTSGSDQFFNSLASNQKSLKVLRLDAYRSAFKHSVDDGFISVCQQLSSLEHLSIEGQIIPEPSLMWIGHLRFLRRLHFVRCDVTPNVISELGKLHFLEELFTGGNGVNNEAGACFSTGFEKLRKLQLSSNTMCFAGYSALSRGLFMNTLSWLCLTGSRSLDNKCIICLAKHLKSLTYLDLSYCYNITDKAIIGMCPRMDTLLHLKLTSCYRLTGGTVDVLMVWVPRLRSLDLSLIWNIAPDRMCELRDRKHSLRSLVGRKHIVYI